MSLITDQQQKNQQDSPVVEKPIKSAPTTPPAPSPEPSAQGAGFVEFTAPGVEPLAESPPPPTESQQENASLVDFTGTPEPTSPPSRDLSAPTVGAGSSVIFPPLWTDTASQFDFGRLYNNPVVEGMQPNAFAAPVNLSDPLAAQRGAIDAGQRAVAQKAEDQRRAQAEQLSAAQEKRNNTPNTPTTTKPFHRQVWDTTTGFFSDLFFGTKEAQQSSDKGGFNPLAEGTWGKSGAGLGGMAKYFLDTSIGLFNAGMYEDALRNREALVNIGKQTNPMIIVSDGKTNRQIRFNEATPEQQRRYASDQINDSPLLKFAGVRINFDDTKDSPGAAFVDVLTGQKIGNDLNDANPNLPGIIIDKKTGKRPTADVRRGRNEAELLKDPRFRRATVYKPKGLFYSRNRRAGESGFDDPRTLATTIVNEVFSPGNKIDFLGNLIGDVAGTVLGNVVGRRTPTVIEKQVGEVGKEWTPGVPKYRQPSTPNAPLRLNAEQRVQMEAWIDPQPALSPSLRKLPPSPNAGLLPEGAPPLNIQPVWKPPVPSAPAAAEVSAEVGSGVAGQPTILFRSVWDFDNMVARYTPEEVATDLAEQKYFIEGQKELLEDVFETTPDLGRLPIDEIPYSVLDEATIDRLVANSARLPVKPQYLIEAGVSKELVEAILDNDTEMVRFLLTDPATTSLLARAVELQNTALVVPRTASPQLALPPANLVDEPAGSLEIYHGTSIKNWEPSYNLEFNASPGELGGGLYTTPKLDEALAYGGATISENAPVDTLGKAISPAPLVYKLTLPEFAAIMNARSPLPRTFIDDLVAKLPPSVAPSVAESVTKSPTSPSLVEVVAKIEEAVVKSAPSSPPAAVLREANDAIRQTALDAGVTAIKDPKTGWVNVVDNTKVKAKRVAQPATKADEAAKVAKEVPKKEATEVLDLTNVPAGTKKADLVEFAKKIKSKVEPPASWRSSKQRKAYYDALVKEAQQKPKPGVVEEGAKEEVGKQAIQSSNPGSTKKRSAEWEQAAEEMEDKPSSFWVEPKGFDVVQEISSVRISQLVETDTIVGEAMKRSARDNMVFSSSHPMLTFQATDKGTLFPLKTPDTAAVIDMELSSVPIAVKGNIEAFDRKLRQLDSLSAAESRYNVDSAAAAAYPDHISSKSNLADSAYKVQHKLSEVVDENLEVVQQKIAKKNETQAVPPSETKKIKERAKTTKSKAPTTSPAPRKGEPIDPPPTPTKIVGTGGAEVEQTIDFNTWKELQRQRKANPNKSVKEMLEEAKNTKPSPCDF